MSVHEFFCDGKKLELKELTITPDWEGMIAEEKRKQEEIEIRCRRLGATFKELKYAAGKVGWSTEELLNAVEDIAGINKTPVLLVEEFKKTEDRIRETTKEELKRRLKYAKNPMEIIALNKQLSGKRNTSVTRKN